MKNLIKMRKEQCPSTLMPIVTIQMPAEDYGMKCAVGFLIEDQFYRPAMEGCGLVLVLDRSIAKAVSRSGWPCETNEHVQFYRGMQRIHDSASYRPVEEVMLRWEHGWKEIADAYDLVYTPPETSPCVLN